MESCFNAWVSQGILLQQLMLDIRLCLGAGQHQPAGLGKHQDLENLAGVAMMGPVSHIPDAFDMRSVLDSSRGA